MSDLRAPWRWDFVGSFLRPAALKEARAAAAAGQISADELRAVEDECIRDLCAKQVAAGFKILTDGEFRRSTWHLDFMWGFEGIIHQTTVEGNTTFDAEAAMIDDTLMVGRVQLTGEHPFVEHFRFVNALAKEAGCAAKQTMPSPCQFFAYFTGAELRAKTLEFYEAVEDFGDDLVAGYTKVLADLYAAGCRTVQFDDCVWGGMVNREMALALTGETDETLPALMEYMVSLNNRVIAAAPEGLTINTHICRGNYHSTWFSSGGYEPVAPLLFGTENVNAYFLEFDDERSGGFEPLRFVSGEKKVVLGLVTTKFPQLEDKEALKARIAEAAQYVPLERLHLSPQCGFASCEIGNKLSEEEQWAKLALVREVAEEVWGA